MKWKISPGHGVTEVRQKDTGGVIDLPIMKMNKRMYILDISRPTLLSSRGRSLDNTINDFKGDCACR